MDNRFSSEWLTQTTEQRLNNILGYCKFNPKAYRYLPANEQQQITDLLGKRNNVATLRYFESTLQDNEPSEEPTLANDLVEA